MKYRKYQIITLLTLITLSFSCDKKDEELITPDPIINEAPAGFDLLRIVNNATGVAVKPSLKWAATSDPDGDPIKYVVFLDENPNPTTLVADNITSTEFQILDRLALEKKYYWRVAARDGNGNVTVCNDTFSFTTRGLNLYNTAIMNSGPFTARASHTTTSHNGNLWVIGGSNDSVPTNDIWQSSDGINWSEVITTDRFAARSSHTAVSFKNFLWVIGGQVYDTLQGANTYLNDVWYSENGVDWFEATSSAAFSGRTDHTTIVFDDKLWVIGGYDEFYKHKSDVWYSEDGRTWTQASSLTPFPARSMHTSEVFDDKIWVIGGRDNVGFKNDVWYSTDGNTWTEATPSADFSNRIQHGTVQFDNKLWVFCGFNVDGGVNLERDAWYTENGINWINVSTSTPFSKRYSHTTTVFDEKIWVVAGFDGRFKNDVWVMN